MASTSAVKLVSGATTFLAPFAIVAIGYTRKPWAVEIASALAQIGVRQEIEDFVRAGAADDAVGVEPVGAADRLAQHPRGAFRIVLQMRRPCVDFTFGDGPNGVSLADSLNTLRPGSGTGVLPGV